MKQQIEQRLKDLRAEFESGQTMLTDLETKQAALKSTLLRISGAIQVLEELLTEAAIAEENNDHLPQSEVFSQSK